MTSARSFGSVVRIEEERWTREVAVTFEAATTLRLPRCTTLSYDPYLAIRTPSGVSQVGCCHARVQPHLSRPRSVRPRPLRWNLDKKSALRGRSRARTKVPHSFSAPPKRPAVSSIIKALRLLTIARPARELGCFLDMHSVRPHQPPKPFRQARCWLSWYPEATAVPVAV